MLKIGVIIVNYMAYEATINCVESFKLQQTCDSLMDIVIVDNASTNNSFDILTAKYKSDININVINLKVNEGFARGNNAGYYFLKEKNDYDYFIFSNDDVILVEKGLFNWIDNCFTKYKFAVLGPKIYSINGRFYQNPLPNKSTRKKDCIREILLEYFEIIKLYIKRILKIKIIEDYIKFDNNKYNRFSDELTLHGSFQVFSKKYFQYYREPYDPRTFLYCEENLLKLRCDNRKLKMIYSPDYKINHLQNLSTDMLEGSFINKRIYRIKCMIKSMKIYYRELD